MSVHSNTDIETFKLLKSDIESTLESANIELQNFFISDNEQSLAAVIAKMNQVAELFQTLPLMAAPSLMLESERLLDGFAAKVDSIDKSSLVVFLERTFIVLKESLMRIEREQADNPVDAIRLVNEIRAAQNIDEIRIQTIFSPVIESLPEISAELRLSDEGYIDRLRSLRGRFQTLLLRWLSKNDASALDEIGDVFDELVSITSIEGNSSEGSARRWSVAGAYTDYVKQNEPKSTVVHGRIFRKIDDHFRDLIHAGESELLNDFDKGLIKTMLFYIGAGEQRSDRMRVVAEQFQLHEYFSVVKFKDNALNESELDDADRVSELFSGIGAIDDLIEDGQLEPQGELVRLQPPLEDLNSGNLKSFEDSLFALRQSNLRPTATSKLDKSDSTQSASAHEKISSANVTANNKLTHIRDKLEKEISQLNSLDAMLLPMTNIMQHLRTINVYSEEAGDQERLDLTGKIQTVLETNFIRSRDDLSFVRKQLEAYLDSVNWVG
mgnify:CR=1 FL=1